MNLLPKASGIRPRMACEISPQGVVAARSVEPGGPLSAVAKADLAEGSVVPSLKPGNLVDRIAVTAALRKALESIGLRPNSRGADVTLIIPDPAARVLLLDFDALPTKLSEALPIVRFRLKKLLPFDADDAMVTFQIMSSSRSLVRVLAVAIPRDVLSDYETAVREAGYEPGAVLPSTLATLPAVDDSNGPALLVNVNTLAVTTAIVRSGVLLLHRTLDLQDHAAASPPNIPAAMFEPSSSTLPLVDADRNVAGRAAQQPLLEHGWNRYADRALNEASVQNEDGITNVRAPGVFAVKDSGERAPTPGDPAYSPYLSPTSSANLNAEIHQSILYAPVTAGSATTGPASEHTADSSQFVAPVTRLHNASAAAEEIARAVSVAAAYFEDTQAKAPSMILSAGTLGAAHITRLLREQGIAQEDGLAVRELVESSALLSQAATASVPRGWLSGVLGALRG